MSCWTLRVGGWVMKTRRFIGWVDRRPSGWVGWWAGGWMATDLLGIVLLNGNRIQDIILDAIDQRLAVELWVRKEGEGEVGLFLGGQQMLRVRTVGGVGGWVGGWVV